MWIVDNIIVVIVVWFERFWNVLYDYNKWLNEVMFNLVIFEFLDDYGGGWFIKKINNMYGNL